MAILKPLLYLTPLINRALYGSFQSHENFDLKPSMLPMTEQDAAHLKKNNIPKAQPQELRGRVEEVPNAHKVDQFFQVRKIEKRQFREVQEYWKKVEFISPWAAAAFMITVLVGAKVCVSGHSKLLKVAGYVVVIAGAILASKCLEDASSSRTNTEILANIDSFQNYGELFAFRRSNLFPQKLKKVLEHESLRLDTDTQRGILHPIEVHSLYKSDILEWCKGLLELQVLFETPQQKERWVISCIQGLGNFFREDVIGNIFRDDPKKQGTLLETRRKLIEIGTKLKEQLTYIRIPEKKIQWITSCIQGMCGLFQRGVIGNSYRDELKRQDDLLEARKKLLVVGKKLKELLAYIQDSEKKNQRLIQELAARMKPLMAKVQELQQKTCLDEFVKIYIQQKNEKEILHYQSLVLEAITLEQWGAQLKDYFEASHRWFQYYPEVQHLLKYAQAVIQGQDFTYQLNKRVVTLVVPPPLDPKTLVLVMTKDTLKAARDRHLFLEVGDPRDYLSFVNAYRDYLAQKAQSAAQSP